MTALTVGLVAPPWVPVPPPSYGGTETVVDTLARGLIAAGHSVVLYATGDSTCPVPRGWTHPVALGTDYSADDELAHVEAAYRALVGHVDVIHDHTVLGPWRLLSRSCPTPVVATNHGPFSDETLRLWEPVSRRLPVVAISAAQAASAPSVSVSEIVHHGIDTGLFPLGAGAGGYVAFLGRMNPDKGPADAIGAARAAGVPIRLAAKMREPEERAYFSEVIEPLLGLDAVYVGEIGGQAKLDLLAGAAALLNPIRWPEPFGLVMIEALACGTPVISFRAGSAPEIVEPGVNGFLCDGVADMAEAVWKAPRLDRVICRDTVEQRFSVGRMIDDYVGVYRRAIGTWPGGPARLPHGTPTAATGASSAAPTA